MEKGKKGRYMSNFLKNIQPAVQKETKKIAISTLLGVLLMWVVFFVLHMIIPEKVPFDYTVILGGIGGGLIAVLNFFLMGLTVQSVASTTDEELARKKMKASYSQRMMMQMIWGIVAVAAPCFNYVAGLLPLLFPSLGIKITGIFLKK